MASTARTIISAALRDIRVLGAGDVASDDDAEDALYQLNNMLDSWWLERLAVYAIRQDSGLSWSAAAQSRTVGSGGNLNITRPFRIVNVVFTFGNVDYPIRKMLDRLKGPTQGGGPVDTFDGRPNRRGLPRPGPAAPRRG